MASGRKAVVPPRKKGKLGVEKHRSIGEGALPDIPPSKSPNYFHGNYGGYGNRGGEPLDNLDLIFKKHDVGYHYTPDPKKRLKHDKALVKMTDKLSKDKSNPLKIRLKAKLASTFFKAKLKKLGEVRGFTRYPGKSLTKDQQSPRGRSPYEIAMANFESGAYGTPDNPHRGSSYRAAFWNAYHGLPDKKYTHGSIVHAHALAGRDAAKKKKSLVKEDSPPQAGLGAGAFASVEPTNKMNPRDPILIKKAKKVNMKGIPKKIMTVEAKKDLIGKKTPSKETIAAKHGIPVDQVEAQIMKGVKVEREHTNSDREAEEIARDHLHEFPDYYDRLDKMETKAKKDMKEETDRQKRDRVKKFMMKKDRQIPPPKTPLPVSIPGTERTKVMGFNVLRRKIIKDSYDPDKEPIRISIEAHKRMEEKMREKHGDASPQASFHRYWIRRLEKELKEDAPAMSVGAGVIAGMPTKDTADQTPVRRKKPDMLRRTKTFAGKKVFVVDPTTYHEAYLGKRRYEHYEKYLGNCDIADEIREFGRKYWAEPIIIENEQTGAMVYLKYGSK